MKHLKKLGSVLLALVMVMALAAPAFAATEAKRAILTSSSTAHTFCAYQIFEAPVTDDGSLRSAEIKWGNGVDTPVKLWNALKSFELKLVSDGKLTSGEMTFTDDKLLAAAGTPTGSVETVIGTDSGAQAVAKLLEESEIYPRGNTTQDWEMNLALAKAMFESGALTRKILVNGTNAVLTGYCLLTDAMTGDEDNIVNYMLYNVNGNTTITPKTSDEKVTKEVWDPKVINQTPDNPGWVGAALYNADEGGANNTEGGANNKYVEFKITVTLPSDLEKYKNVEGGYTIELHDRQEAGLEFVGIKSVTGFKAKAGTGTSISENIGYTIKTIDLTDGCDFEIIIPDAQELTQTGPDGKIEIIYQAELTDDATTGADGNTNEVTMEVNGKEYKADATVFELELNIDKINANKQPLSGAKFALIPEAQYNTLWDAEKNDYADGKSENDLEPYALTADQGDSQNHHAIKGIDAGTYYVVEYKTPGAEYTRIKPIQVKITAEVDQETKTFNVTVDEDNGYFSETEDNKVNATIENRTDTLLPETGGIGTTIFYIVGGVLVVGAVVLLITKRRTSVDDE